MPVAEKKNAMAKAAALPNEGGEPNRAIGFVTRTGDFLKEVRSEMRKVVTPSWSEVQSTTAIVLVTVFAFAGFFYVVDAALGQALQHVLHWLGGTQ